MTHKYISYINGRHQESTVDDTFIDHFDVYLRTEYNDTFVVHHVWPSIHYIDCFVLCYD